jgi:hypothetical protein
MAIRPWHRLIGTLLVVLAACASVDPAGPAASAAPDAAAQSTTTSGPAPTTVEATEPSTTELAASTTAVPLTGVAPPEWLGTRPLPLRPGETIAIAAPTPDELTDRQFWTTDLLPPPPDDTFVGTVASPAPDEVIERSTWTEACPVDRTELAWVTVSFFGFDHRFHTGELLVHAEHADAIAGVFERLHELRFPIEEMRVTTLDELTAPRTGDGNNTSSFVCRPAVNSTTWSRHAFGTAIDLNPFHNPYVRDDVVIPELASAYLDRERFARGMVHADVVAAFDDIGWGWGGAWSSSSDWMHFSDTGT